MSWALNDFVVSARHRAAAVLWGACSICSSVALAAPASASSSPAVRVVEPVMDAVTVKAEREAPAPAPAQTAALAQGTRDYIGMLENLGDLYARMAAEAYGEATQLGGGRPAVLSKLALLHQVLATAGMTVGLPVTAGVVPALSAGGKGVHAVPISAVPELQTHDGKQEVLHVMATVAAWARAWEQQDMSAYYAAYSEEFTPPQGTRQSWEQERKARIVGRSAITVDFNDLRVQVQQGQASASFLQLYASGDYQSNTRKTLHLRQEGQQWRIVREEAGG